MKQTACKDHLCEETKEHPLALAAHNQFHDLTYAGLIVPKSYFITDLLPKTDVHTCSCVFLAVLIGNHISCSFCFDL